MFVGNFVLARKSLSLFKVFVGFPLELASVM